MAEGTGGSQERNRGRRRREQEHNEGRPVHLDIGLGEPQNTHRPPSPDWHQPTGEPGCFSLRHFLRESEPGRQHQQSDGTLPPGTPPPSPRLDMASALPDFVQDHLVMEQSFLGSTGSGNAFRIENIPQHLAAMQRDSDFSMGGDIPFDLMASNPPPHQEPSDASGGGGGASNPPDIQSAGKRLPDFLSDGPIRRVTPQQTIPLQMERLQSENERMRLELEMLRQQLSQQIQRNESLEVEMNRQMSRERSNASSNSNEKLEDELFKMTKRALTAENRASKLKEYVDSLKSQSGYGSMGAASTSAQQTQSERLASQLRNAANTAEVSLRQLLNGVENLRHLATSLEPVMQQKVVASDSDDDDAEMPDSSRAGGGYR